MYKARQEHGWSSSLNPSESDHIKTQVATNNNTKTWNMNVKMRVSVLICPHQNQLLETKSLHQVNTSSFCIIRFFFHCRNRLALIGADMKIRPEFWLQMFWVLNILTWLADHVSPGKQDFQKSVYLHEHQWGMVQSTWKWVCFFAVTKISNLMWWEKTRL